MDRYYLPRLPSFVETFPVERNSSAYQVSSDSRSHFASSAYAPAGQGSHSLEHRVYAPNRSHPSSEHTSATYAATPPSYDAPHYFGSYQPARYRPAGYQPASNQPATNHSAINQPASYQSASYSSPYHTPNQHAVTTSPYCFRHYDRPEPSCSHCNPGRNDFITPRWDSQREHPYRHERSPSPRTTTTHPHYRAPSPLRGSEQRRQLNGAIYGSDITDTQLHARRMLPPLQSVSLCNRSGRVCDHQGRRSSVHRLGTFVPSVHPSPAHESHQEYCLSNERSSAEYAAYALANISRTSSDSNTSSGRRPTLPPFGSLDLGRGDCALNFDSRIEPTPTSSREMYTSNNCVTGSNSIISSSGNRALSSTVAHPAFGYGTQLPISQPSNTTYYREAAPRQDLIFEQMLKDERKLYKDEIFNQICVQGDNPTGKDKAKRQPCFFSKEQEGCWAAQDETVRQVISHYFGRNKTQATWLKTHGHFSPICRKHYQRSRYHGKRAGGGFRSTNVPQAMIQAVLIEQVWVSLSHETPHIQWEITFQKSMLEAYEKAKELGDNNDEHSKHEATFRDTVKGNKDDKKLLEYRWARTLAADASFGQRFISKHVLHGAAAKDLKSEQDCRDTLDYLLDILARIAKREGPKLLDQTEELPSIMTVENLATCLALAARWTMLISLLLLTIQFSRVCTVMEHRGMPGTDRGSFELPAYQRHQGHFAVCSHGWLAGPLALGLDNGVSIKTALRLDSEKAQTRKALLADCLHLHLHVMSALSRGKREPSPRHDRPEGTGWASAEVSCSRTELLAPQQSPCESEDTAGGAGGCAADQATDGDGNRRYSNNIPELVDRGSRGGSTRSKFMDMLTHFGRAVMLNIDNM
ncbi:hypothetical protein FH972_022448 [Carpinus fangiana]|uniref:Uncharacterized protein n=1 Tax=Carpinus fangiana TaxID=176857 RepID=A0A5N6KSM0_9ROSI|nr:hypothetical protein FH972_022448 [Carpinus fangiana]